MAAGGEGESDDESADGSEEKPADPASDSEGDNDSSEKKKDTSQQDKKDDKQQAGGKQEEQAKPEKQQENGQKKEDSSQQKNKDSSQSSSSSSGEDAKGTGGGTQGKSQDNVKGPERSAKNTTEGEPPSAVSNKVLQPPHIGQHVEPEQLSVLDVCNPMCLLAGLHTSSVSNVGADLT